jgi:hypothetical protein
VVRLDVPKFSREDGYIVNCTVVPGFSLDRTTAVYPPGAGMGGSAAVSILHGESAIASELQAGVGWQDPAILLETGLVAWRSGAKPQLSVKRDPRPMLNGRMALLWTGRPHDVPTAELVGRSRPYDKIAVAGRLAQMAVANGDFLGLVYAVNISCGAQEDEGMETLGFYGSLGRKYCGSGWGGYALYLFGTEDERDKFVNNHEAAMQIEPYIREWK